MTTQELYLQLKEGKISNEKFLYEVRRDANLPWVTNLTSFNDAVQILKNKSIITEAKTEQEEAPRQILTEARKKEEKSKDANHVIWDQFQRGIKYELEQQGDLDLEKAQKKALANINKDPLYYIRLVNGQKLEKKRSDTMEYVDNKMSNMVDERNQMKIAKKDAKANVQDTLGKKEKGTKKPKKVKIMSMIPKKSKGVKVMDVPGKEKVMKLKEAMDEAYVNPQGQLNMEEIPGDILAIIKKMFFFNDAEAMAFYNNNKDTFEDAIDMGLNPKAAVETVAFFNTQLNEDDLEEVVKVVDEKGDIIKVTGSTGEATSFVNSQNPNVRSKLKVRP